MDVPETVRVLGLTYTVETTELDDDYGRCIPNHQRIELDGRMGSEKREQTFLHELVHAILAQLGREEEYGDEQLVQGLALGLHEALFRDS